MSLESAEASDARGDWAVAGAARDAGVRGLERDVERDRGREADLALPREDAVLVERARLRVTTLEALEGLSMAETSLRKKLKREEAGGTNAS